MVTDPLQFVPAPVQTESRAHKPVWKAGTLRYTKAGLLVLFSWLLCNDLCLMLMEQVSPQLTPLLLKSHGATNADLGLVSSLTGIFTIWINPVVSTWSDRHRGPYGRRRPFLFFAAPLAALLLAAIPFAPRLAPLLGLSETTGVIIVVGICTVLYAVFNSVITAIFMYYFWDVVPEALLGRFTALTKVVSMAVTFGWNYFLFGLAEKYMEEIYVGVAGFFLAIYLISLWQVKEGDYPPVPQDPKVGLISGIRTYFVECYCQPYYLWIYGAFAAYQVGGLSLYLYQIFYLHDQLHLSLDTIGKMRAWPALAIILVAYPLGSLIDRLKPVRLVSPILIFWALASLLSFYYLRDQWSLLICLGLMNLASFGFTVAFGVLNVEVFPREKLGQFCSATAIFYQIINFILAVPLGMLFDYLKDYRYIFLWTAIFEVISALMFLKVYSNWKALGDSSESEGAA